MLEDRDSWFNRFLMVILIQLVIHMPVSLSCLTLAAVPRGFPPVADSLTGQLPSVICLLHSAVIHQKFIFHWQYFIFSFIFILIFGRCVIHQCVQQLLREKRIFGLLFSRILFVGFLNLMFSYFIRIEFHLLNQCFYIGIIFIKRILIFIYQ